MPARIKYFTMLSCLLVLLAGAAIPRADHANVKYDLRGVPPIPGALSWNRGHRVGDVNLSDGFGRLDIPIYSLVGRGGVSFPLGLYYSSNVKGWEVDYNKNNQASWVGLGWGLDAPFVFGSMEVDIEAEGTGIEDVRTGYNLFWNGVRDPIKSSGTWGLKYNKYWKFEKTLDENGYVLSFTLTDLNGTKYTFGHRRITCLVLYDETEEMVDFRTEVPYRWDLKKIEDVTGNNSISIEYEDVIGETLADEYYTQASYLDTIRCDASGSYLAFTRKSREDYEPDPKEPDIYEKEKLTRIVLKDSAGSTLWRYELHHSYHDADRGSEGKKLLLDAVQQCKPDSSGVLPAWEFEYIDNESSNDGALATVTSPDGGEKTYTYTSYSYNYRVAAVVIDGMMGAAPDTTYYSSPSSLVTVTPPGDIGCIKYYLKTSAYGLNEGTLDSVVVYNSDELPVNKTEFALVDSTIIYRAYDYTKNTEIIDDGEVTDTLVSQRWTFFSTLNGLPTLIREQVSPFRPRGYAAGPDSVDSYWRTRQITYAFQNYSGMDAVHTHQLEAIWKEVIREETRSTTYGNKTSPLQAKWTTFDQYGSSYYYPEKEWVWTASTTAGDTTLPADPPSNTDEKVVVREVTSMDAYGHVLVEEDGEEAITKYYYGDNSNNLDNSATGLQHRYLTGVRRLKSTSDDNSNDLMTKTDWDGNTGLKTSEEDENSSFIYYLYDDYLRPSQVQNHSPATVQRTDYAYSRDLSGTGSFDPTKPNYVRTIRFFTYGGPADSTHTTEFTDGWGRKIEQQQRNGDNDIITAWSYYPDGALLYEYVPYETDSDHAYHDPSTSPWPDTTKYEWESDPRRRLYRVTFPTMDTANRPQVSLAYGIETVDGHKYLTRTRTDENSVAHKEWLNRDGTVFEQSTASDYEARAWRDALGADYLVLPPRTNLSMSSALGTLITYGRFGREIQRGEPDQGTTRTVYDRALRPIWLQEASDASENDFWATIYDVFGRSTRIGKESDQSSSWFTRVPTAPTSTYGEEADEWRKKYTYDADAFGSGTTYAKGRLTKYEGNWDTESDDVENYEWYQYAREGWITKVRQAVAGFDTTDTEYEYDTGGRLRKVSYDSGNSTTRFFLWYDYDLAGRLYKIYHATSDEKPGTATTEYTWNARGQASQQVLGGSVQTVDFTYNNRGFLTKINDPASLGTDRFAMELGYDAKVTGGPDTNWGAENNGNISQIKWVNRKFNDTALYYTFNYDNRDYLTKADCSDNSYDVGTYSYDDNGNIATRNDGTLWTYNYDGNEANTNRVDDISSLTSDDNWDYDNSGRQTKDTYSGFTSATYHFPGAAFHDITMSGGTLQMRYGKDNRRLQKNNTANEGITTDYVRDLEGRVLAVFEGNTLVERYVWGPLGLVAIVKGTNDSPTTYYTLNDHLGYVRSVVSTDSTAVAGYDYFPYGKELRSSVDSGAGSRFRFGAKEYDTELSLNLYYFEARFYNADIGRFVTPDPAKEGWSHYCYAMNSPLIFTDPTGLYWEYSQSTGDLTWYPYGSGSHYVGTGFSGKGDHMNNPASQEIHSQGPIPQGEWHIGDVMYLGANGTPWIPLTYMDGKIPGDRYGFWIHPGTVSTGCIVLPEDIVERIAQSGDNQLVVVP